MKQPGSLIDRALSAVSIVMLATVVAVGGYKLFVLADLGGTAPAPSETVQASEPGPHIRGGTLQLVLGSSCPYCDKSIPFYHALLTARRPGDFHTVAVFSTRDSLGEQYVKAHGLEVDQVRQADLAQLGVIGTPAVQWLDAEGNVLHTWMGMLSPGTQSELVDTIGIREEFVAATDALKKREIHENAARVPTLSASEFMRALREGSSFAVVDTRHRFLYAQGHIENAVSMPLDELAARGPVELGKYGNGSRVVIFCHYDGPCEEEERARKSLTQCVLAGSILTSAGVENVMLLTADAAALKAEGVPMAKGRRPAIRRTPVDVKKDVRL